MSVALLTKDPNAMLDYGFDWTAYLNSQKTISNSTWIVPSGLTNNSTAVNGNVTTIVLSGGVLTKQYLIRNQVTFSDGTIDERSFVLWIQQK
jgi:hypothetical protein